MENQQTRPNLGRSRIKTADPELMRAINRFHVLDAIRQHGPISRVEIADRTELSRATISAITGALIEDALIDAKHVQLVNGGPRGRPRVMLELNRQAAYVCGVRLSADRISIAVTDFRADVVGAVNLPIRPARQTVGVVADIIEDGVRQCVADAGLRLDDISGIGIGLPGVIDARTGIFLSSPILSDDSTDLAALLDDRFAAPVTVENDAHLVALAERWFGHGRDVDSFAVITLEQALGIGAFVGDELFLGARGLGPAFGALAFAPADAAGRPGSCVDDYASQAGILARAVAAGCVSPADGDVPTPTLMRRLVDRALEGNAALLDIYARAGQALGFGIAQLTNLTNPSKVILSGQGLQALELMRETLEHAVETWTAPELRGTTEIIFVDEDDEVWARGAACAVLRQLYEAPWSGGQRGARQKV